MRKLKENKMKKHILVLLLMLVFIFGVRELNKLDETVKMPFIENFREERLMKILF